MCNMKNGLGLVVALIAVSTGATADPLSYPWETYGGVSVSDGVSDGKGGHGQEAKFNAYVEQGAVWKKCGEWSLNTYVGGELTYTGNSDKPWDNLVSPAVGLKLVRQLKLSEGNWGSVSVGVKVQRDTYLEGDPSKDGGFIPRLEFRWSAGGGQ